MYSIFDFDRYGYYLSSDKKKFYNKLECILYCKAHGLDFSWCFNNDYFDLIDLAYKIYMRNEHKKSETNTIILSCISVVDMTVEIYCRPLLSMISNQMKWLHVVLFLTASKIPQLDLRKIPMPKSALLLFLLQKFSKNNINLI